MAPPAGAQEGSAFDVVATYHRLLADDPDLTMPVAAIESLILALADTPASTVSETLDLVSTLTARLKRAVPNAISLSAGTDLFQQYLISTLQRPGASSSSSSAAGDFEQVRAHLVQNGKLFVQRAKAARDTIAAYGRNFIRDGDTVLTNGGSRVVGALLAAAATSTGPNRGGGSVGGGGGGTTRFRVVYVCSPGVSAHEDESAATVAALRERGVPVAVIPSTAVAYSLDRVTRCFVGAEGVVENGGIVSRMGTYQMALLAKAAGKPFYVVGESHKFVRLYPLDQHDLGLEQNVVEFRTADGVVDAKSRSPAADEGVADLEDAAASGKAACRIEEAVDYTPPHLITGIITESGVLLPSAVSEELIKVWF